MKQAIALLILSLFLPGLAGSRLVAQTPGPESAASFYNDFIVEQQTKIGVILVGLQDEMNAEPLDAAVLWTFHDSLVRQIALSIEAVKALPPFEGNSEFRDVAVELLKFYQKSMGIDYKTLLEIIIRQEYSEADIATMQQILESITAEEAIYDSRFKVAQDGFAATHGMELLENELNDQLKE